MFHLDASIFRYEQCNFNGIPENMHALDIRQKHRMKKNVADRMQCTVQGPKRIWPEVAECKGAKMNKRNKRLQGLEPQIR